MKSKSKPKDGMIENVIRINRLKVNEKYYFAKRIGKARIIVRCCNKNYLLKLPVHLQDPSSNINYTSYLIRKSPSARVVWKN